MKSKEAVILVGHGAVASDTPRHLITELKQLEAQRKARHLPSMSAREFELDAQVRRWPRNKKTDPYWWGLNRVARKLKVRTKGKKLAVAYNEFCDPSVEQAIEQLVSEGFRRIFIVSTMFTRGGIHAEFEIPQIVRDASKKFPSAAIRYAWPYREEYVADFLAGQLRRMRA